MQYHPSINPNISLNEYGHMPLHEQRLWRMYNIPRMDEVQIVKFYLRCIKPLEVDREATILIANEIKHDEEYSKQFQNVLKEEIDRSETQIAQLIPLLQQQLDQASSDPAEPTGERID